MKLAIARTGKARYAAANDNVCATECQTLHRHDGCHFLLRIDPQTGPARAAPEIITHRSGDPAASCFPAHAESMTLGGGSGAGRVVHTDHEKTRQRFRASNDKISLYDCRCVRQATASNGAAAPLCRKVSMPPPAIAATRYSTSAGMPAARGHCHECSDIAASAMLSPPDAEPVTPASAVTGIEKDHRNDVLNPLRAGQRVHRAREGARRRSHRRGKARLGGWITSPIR